MYKNKYLIYTHKYLITVECLNNGQHRMECLNTETAKLVSYSEMCIIPNKNMQIFVLKIEKYS